MTRIITVFVGLLALASAASAQSNIRHARLESRPGADLAGTFQTLSSEAGPLWIGYAVPAQNPDWNACCHNSDRGGNSCCGRCLLDEGRSGGETRGGNVARGPVQLEGASQALVLYRIENREVQRIRAYSESCELDAGGRTVYWLTGVSTTASIDLLLRHAARPIADDDRRDRVADGAMVAIANHRDAAADRALAALMASDKPTATRKQAAFWAAHSPRAERIRAGPHGAARHVQRRDAAEAPDVRRVAEPRARGGGHADERREERCQSSRARRSDLLARAEGRPQGGERDHGRHRQRSRNQGQGEARCSHSVSCRKDDGVPRLIDVARTNRNPAVRKQAIFWLGQSRDPRALGVLRRGPGAPVAVRRADGRYGAFVSARIVR